jgi:integrase
MANRIRTDKHVEHAKVGRTLTDFPGLYIDVSEKTGLKVWVYRYFFQGKPWEKRVGRWPYQNLRTARDRAMAMKGLLLDRIDPKETYKWDEKVQKKFAEAANEWIAIQKPSQLYNTNLLLHVHGKALAAIPVYKITKDDVDKAIAPLRAKHRIQAKRTIKMWARLFDYAEFKGYRAGPNPAKCEGNIEHTFPPMDPVQPHRHLHYMLIPDFMRDLSIKGERSVGAVALQFLILTAARTKQVLEARWDEIDFENQLWNLQYDRMKARKEYRVPLSARTLTLLERQRQCSNGSPYIFTGYGGQTPLSKKSMYRIAPQLTTVAGQRKTFRTWAGEKTDFPWEVCEMALAHSIGSRVAQAYWRGDAIEKRRELMEAWADFCDQKVLQ